MHPRYGWWVPARREECSRRLRPAIVILALPIPFDNLFAAWAILFFCLALLESDGVMAMLGWLFALLTLAWTAACWSSGPWWRLASAKSSSLSRAVKQLCAGLSCPRDSNACEGFACCSRITCLITLLPEAFRRRQTVQSSSQRRRSRAQGSGPTNSGKVTPRSCADFAPRQPDTAIRQGHAARADRRLHAARKGRAFRRRRLPGVPGAHRLCGSRACRFHDRGRRCRYRGSRRSPATTAGGTDANARYSLNTVNAIRAVFTMHCTAPTSSRTKASWRAVASLTTTNAGCRAWWQRPDELPRQQLVPLTQGKHA